MTDRQAAGTEIPDENGDRIGVCFAGISSEGAERSVLRALLETAFISNGVEDIDSPDAADDGIGLPVVFPMPDPVQTLAQALQDGTAPAQALADWQGRIQDVLNLCRRHRRRVLVLAAEPLAAAETQSLDLLAARLDLPRSEDPVLPSAAAPTSEPSALNLLLARVLLASDPEAQAQADELGAVMAGPSASAAAAQDLIGQVWSDASSQRTGQAEAMEVLESQVSQRVRDLQMTETALTQTREQQDEARKQIDLLRETLSQTVQANAELAEQLELREAELTELRGATGNYVELLAEAEATQKALRSQLHKANSLVADRDKTISAFAADLDKLNKTQTTEQGTSHALRAQQQHLIEERDLLSQTLQEVLAEVAQMEQRAEQLHERAGDVQVLKSLKGALERQIASGLRERQMREAVLGQMILDTETRLRAAQSQYQAQYQAQSETLQGTEAELKAARKQNRDQKKLAKQIAKDLAERERLLAEQQQQIDNMAAELTRIYGSKSWKVTEPMRKARSQLSTKKS